MTKTVVNFTLHAEVELNPLGYGPYKISVVDFGEYTWAKVFDENNDLIFETDMFEYSNESSFKSYVENLVDKWANSKPIESHTLYWKLRNTEPFIPVSCEFVAQEA